jgi:hypothetical protein
MGFQKLNKNQKDDLKDYGYVTFEGTSYYDWGFAKTQKQFSEVEKKARAKVKKDISKKVKVDIDKHISRYLHFWWAKVNGGYYLLVNHFRDFNKEFSKDVLSNKVDKKIKKIVMKKPTISEIKSNTEINSPYFFSRDTLKFFGQTMKSFKVYKDSNNRIFIYAKMYDRDRNYQGDSIREYIDKGENSELKPTNFNSISALQNHPSSKNPISDYKAPKPKSSGKSHLEWLEEQGFSSYDMGRSLDQANEIADGVKSSYSKVKVVKTTTEANKKEFPYIIYVDERSIKSNMDRDFSKESLEQFNKGNESEQEKRFRIKDTKKKRPLNAYFKALKEAKDNDKDSFTYKGQKYVRDYADMKNSDNVMVYYKKAGFWD